MNTQQKKPPIYINGIIATTEDLNVLEQWLKMGKITATAKSTKYGIYFETP